jgi:hypothetical protein
MRIFVADEHPPAGFVYTRRRALQISPSAGFQDIACGRDTGGSGERKWLPFYPSSKARPLAVN